MHIVLLVISSLFVALSSLALNFELHTIKNLGLCLNAPVFVGDYMAARSCSERQVAFINLNNYEDITWIDMAFEPARATIKLGNDTYGYLELDDEILLIYDLASLELTVISGGKMHKSPRITPPSAIFDDVEINFSYENHTLWASLHDKKTKAQSQKAMVGQRSLMFKNIIDDVEYTAASGSIKAQDLKTDQTVTLSPGSMPSAVTKVNDRYLINANWGDNTVSLIDKNNYTIAQTIAVGKHPVRPVVYKNKIYISNYGDGSMSIIEFKDMLSTVKKLNQ